MHPALITRVVYERLADMRAEAEARRYMVRATRPFRFPLRIALTLLPWRSAAPRCCVAGA